MNAGSSEERSEDTRSDVLPPKFLRPDCPLQVEKLCTRCGMICIDQKTGVRSREPLRTLTRLEGRRNTFGVLLKHVTGTQAANQSAVLSVGDHVDILEG